MADEGTYRCVATTSLDDTYGTGKYKDTSILVVVV